MKKARRLMLGLSEASRQSSRSIRSLLYEMIRLRLSVGRVGLSEYLEFRLYLNDINIEEKRCFGGWRAQMILEKILVDDYSRFISADKITMYSLLNNYGLPIPTLRAVYRSRRPHALLQLDSLRALMIYLETPSSTPVYLKPSMGSYGRGNTLIRQSIGEYLVLGDGTTVKTREFCQTLDERHGLGWILQEPLVPHPDISEVCGNKISGIRIYTFLSKERPSIVKAVWKINIGKEDSDNFRHGESGNLLAALDINTGHVTRVVSGTGLDQQVDPPHPLSGAKMTGFRIPHWNHIKSIVLDAHLAFPGYLCPGWDIAVCEDGPKILEVNYFGDIDLPQHAYRSGFIDDNFLFLMRSRGIENLLCATSGNFQRSPTNNRMGRCEQHWSW